MSSSDLKDIFEREFGRPPSSVEQRAAETALGVEYPAGLDTYSFVSKTEFRTVAQVVTDVGGGRVVDVGCGRGGPGLWVAGTTGARLTGLDIAEAALAHARRLADRLSVDADFEIGSFESTGQADGVADVVMSVDAFLFTPDKRAGFVELGRVLALQEMRDSVERMTRRFLMIAEKPVASTRPLERAEASDGCVPDAAR